MQHPNHISFFAVGLLTAAILAGGCNQPVSYPTGGYDYPVHYTARDTQFYFYPVRNNFSRKDSFRRATEFFFFSEWKEPNLSIRPFGEDIFRLAYSEALGYSTIITLTKDSISIKTIRCIKDVFSDREKSLTPKERLLLHFFQNFYPLDPNRYKNDTVRQKYLNMLLSAHPQLRDVNYYWHLYCKAYPPVADSCFTLKVTTVPLSTWDFNHLVSVINNSGYWKMPSHLPCEPCCADGDSFSLEANTGKKYNYVEYGSCNDTEPEQRAFEKACQEIVRYAGLDKKINLYNDSPIAVDSAGSK